MKISNRVFWASVALSGCVILALGNSINHALAQADPPNPFLVPWLTAHIRLETAVVSGGHDSTLHDSAKALAATSQDLVKDEDATNKALRFITTDYYSNFRKIRSSGDEISPQMMMENEQFQITQIEVAQNARMITLLQNTSGMKPIAPKVAGSSE